MKKKKLVLVQFYIILFDRLNLRPPPSRKCINPRGFQYINTKVRDAKPLDRQIYLKSRESNRRQAK